MSVELYKEKVDHIMLMGLIVPYRNVFCYPDHISLYFLPQYRKFWEKELSKLGDLSIEQLEENIEVHFEGFDIPFHIANEFDSLMLKAIGK